MNKKKVFILALAVCLIAILSMSTLAWFNSTADVKNEFLFDDTDGDGSPDFEVIIYETKNDGTNDTTEDGNQYTHVAPGAVLAKDPTVKNEGDYDMYTRVVVTLDNATAWKAISNKYSIAANSDLILEEMVEINAKWVRFDVPVYDSTADTLTYVYYYNEIVGTEAANNTTESLFTQVTIPTAPQQDDLRFGNDKFSITVKADAIQSDNIIADGATITGNEAYTAFSNANWAAGLEYPQPTTNP